jgi:hypothetical protein
MTVFSWKNWKYITETESQPGFEFGILFFFVPKNHILMFLRGLRANSQAFCALALEAGERPALLSGHFIGIPS